MNKDRRITIISIFIWAICVIILVGYYKVIKPRENPGNEDRPISTSENKDNNENDNDNGQSDNKYEAEAKKILSQMNLSEKVGQMFFVRCPEKNAEQIVADYKIGAYILFARDFEGETKDSVKKNIESYQDKAKIPLLIGVDEEGGTVTRVSRFSNFRTSKFKSPMELYGEDGLNAIAEDTVEKCKLLSSLGINVNFAPVCDVTTDETAFMYTRTLGKSAEETAEYVKQVVNQMNSSNMGSVLKHFPGYGNNKDTHIGSSNDDRSIEDFRKTDFLPFKAGIEAGAQCILISHNVVNAIDSKNPASLSAEVHNILRDELGYNGVIITDDLVMDAITGVTNDSEAAVSAVLAGNDMLISSNYDKQISAVINAVNDGRISEDTINKAVLRVLCWKLSLGLFD